MTLRSFAPNPLARTFLELAERHATGDLVFGASRVSFVRGSIVGIGARQTSAERDAFAEASPWVVLLARALSQAETSGDSQTAFTASADEQFSSAPHADTLTLLLDALAANVTRAQASMLESRIDDRLEVLDAPRAQAALRWAGIDTMPVRTTLPQMIAPQPAVAPKIFALIRAGFARVVPASHSIPPAPARPSFAGPAPQAQEFNPSLPPPRPASVLLEPGLAKPLAAPQDLRLELPQFGPVAFALEDPLLELENQISRLEQSGAEGPKRAETWREAARLWRVRFGAVEESTRALREAAAADPTDVVSLQEASIGVAAMGDVKLALAYARSAAAGAQPGRPREKALTQVAYFYLLRGEPAGAISALRSAMSLEVLREETIVRLAILLERAGEFEEASEYFALAAERFLNDNPDRAAAFFSEAVRLAPSEEVRERRGRLLETGQIRHEVTMPTRALVEASFSRSVEEARSRVDRWLALSPWSPEAHTARIEILLAGDAPRDLLEAAARAIDETIHATDLADWIRRAIDELAQRGMIDDALTLAIRALDRLGATHDALRAQTDHIAEHARNAALKVATFERLLAPLTALERAQMLLRIAGVHRAVGDRAAEARAWLRVLAGSHHHEEAIRSLASIYGECGETERLIAVLTLRLERAESHDERADALIDLATAAARIGKDTKRSDHFIDQIIREAEGAEALIGKALGALVSLGRPLGAIERAIALSATAPSEVGARLLERALVIAESELEDPTLALRVVLRGLEIAPHHGELLVALERLCLELSELGLARTAYDRLVAEAVGPNSRRALLYRAGRLYERAGAHRAALDAYVQAFAESPNAGVIFHALERLGGVLSDLEPFIGACISLSEVTRHADQRVGYLRRAADVLDDTLGQKYRAFETLIRAWSITPTRELEDTLRGLVRTLISEDRTAGLNAARTLADRFVAKVDDSWDTEDKTTWLLRAVRVLAEDANEYETALLRWEHAKELLAKGPIETDAHVAILCSAAELLRAIPNAEADAQICAAKAFALDPSNERVRAMAKDFALTADEQEATESVASEEQSAPAQNETEAAQVTSEVAEAKSDVVDAKAEVAEAKSDVAESPVEVPPQAADVVESAAPAETAPDGGEAIDALPAADAPVEETAAAPDAVAEVVAPSEPPPLSWQPTGMHVQPADADLIQRVLMAGNLDDAERLVDVLAPDPTRLHEAHLLLLHVVRRDPSRLQALRALHAIALKRNLQFEAQVCASLLSITDPSIVLPEKMPTADLDDDVVAAAYNDALPRTLRDALRVVWENASPIFKKKLDYYRVMPMNRVPPLANTPVARAWRHATRVVGDTQTNLYFRRENGNFITVARTAPPSIVIMESASSSERVLRFRFARALILARPQNLLMSTLDADEGRTLIDALHAAFEVAYSEGTANSKEVQLLVAELWRMPSRAQREVRNALQLHGTNLNYAVARESTEIIAARAGLLACGDPAAALMGLAEDDALLSSEPVDWHNQSHWARIMKKSATAAALVRFALSDAHLVALARSER